MHVLILYDVPVDYDPYREKIAHILKEAGLERLQFSVFKGEITKNVLETAILKLNLLLDKIPSDVRIFPLCRACEESAIAINYDDYGPYWARLKHGTIWGNLRLSRKGVITPHTTPPPEPPIQPPVPPLMVDLPDRYTRESPTSTSIPVDLPGSPGNEIQRATNSRSRGQETKGSEDSGRGARDQETRNQETDELIIGPTREITGHQNDDRPPSPARPTPTNLTNLPARFRAIYDGRYDQLFNGKQGFFQKSRVVTRANKSGVDGFRAHTVGRIHAKSRRRVAKEKKKAKKNHNVWVV